MPGIFCRRHFLPPRRRNTGEGEWINVKEAGVQVVSFSGARGKELLGEENWEHERYKQARRDRNGAESGISVLKDKVRFGQLSS